MARYTGPACRLCRSQGMKLFLKGDRCMSDKCALEKRNYPPGQHGPEARRRETEYLIQLKEKQKARRIYGVNERQFRNYFELAERQKGLTGENLLGLLECRLDNVVYRLGFAPSRRAARQLVRHRHFLVNNRVVDIPSYLVKPGDVIGVREKSRNLEVIQAGLSQAGRGRLPAWLELNREELTGRVLERPKREDIPVPVQEDLIVGFYSK